MKKAEDNSAAAAGNVFKGRLAVTLCCAGIAAILSAGTAMAQSPVILVPGTVTEEADGPGTKKTQTETVRIQALVKAVEDGAILVESRSEDVYQGEILLNISIFDTQIVNGATGFQAELTDIQKGSVIYADIRTAMTRSLPPQTTAETVICNMPEGISAPEYILTKSIEWQPDESWRLVSSVGTEYQIPGNCPVISYNMNELSGFRIISESSRLLVWMDENNQPWKILKLPLRW